jgi:hypothetical protein
MSHMTVLTPVTTPVTLQKTRNDIIRSNVDRDGCKQQEGEEGEHFFSITFVIT